MKNIKENLLHPDNVNIPGAYIAVGEGNGLYSASYSPEFDLLFFAIPKSVSIQGYVRVADLPEMTFDSVEENAVFRYNDSWLLANEVFGPFESKPYKTVYASVKGDRKQTIIRLYPN